MPRTRALLLRYFAIAVLEGEEVGREGDKEAPERRGKKRRGESKKRWTRGGGVEGTSKVQISLGFRTVHCLNSYPSTLFSLPPLRLTLSIVSSIWSAAASTFVAIVQSGHVHPDLRVHVGASLALRCVARAALPRCTACIFFNTPSEEPLLRNSANWRTRGGGSTRAQGGSGSDGVELDGMWRRRGDKARRKLIKGMPLVRVS